MHTIFAIGTVSSSVVCPVDTNWGATTSRIVLDPQFAAGLAGLEKFSHLIVVYFLDKAKFDPEKHLHRQPRGLPTMPEVGIFSQRAKDRPNSIGITTVKIRKVGPDYVDVDGLDAIDSTPVIDLKPYYPAFDRVDQPYVPYWVDELMENYF